MKRLSRSVLVVLAAALVGVATMSFECGPPGRDIPCSDQIAEGDVLHIELVARYAPDGEISGGDGLRWIWRCPIVCRSRRDGDRIYVRCEDPRKS